MTRFHLRLPTWLSAFLRFLRRALLYFFALSLPIVALFVIALWILSLTLPGSTLFNRDFSLGHFTYHLTAASPGISLALVSESPRMFYPHVVPPPPGTNPPVFQTDFPSPVLHEYRFLGGSYSFSSQITRATSTATETRATMENTHHLIAPYWISLPLLLPLLLLLLRPSRIIIPGFCPTCRYDLRAHHPGDKCPECGSIIPAAAA